MNKKILGIILTISMLVSLIIVPNTAHAAIGIDHEAEVSKLNAFGILSGYPDASYNASAQVTAQTFIDAAYKAAGAADAAQYDTTAAKFGVKYDDKTITAQNAGAILLTLLNYYFEAEAKGGYPSGYNSLISNYDLLDGTKQALDAPLTNDAMAVMLYNSLELYAITIGSSYGQPAPQRTGKTVMQELDIYEGRGVVTGTEFAAMSGSRRGGGNSVVIDNTRSLLMGRTYADNLLGYSVEYYYSLNESTLLWIEPRNTNVVTRIAEVDIQRVDESGITFDNENGRSKTYSFRNPTFVYNGKQVTAPDFDMFIPKAGYVVTVDNDGDNRPEVVMCESYEYFLVGSKNPSDGFINDYETSRAVSLSDNDYASLKIVKNGVQVTLDDVAEKDVIALMRSDTTKGAAATAIISGYAPVSGTINAVSSEDVTIDGEHYKLSTAYEGAALELKMSGTFYRDLNGNIVRYTKGTVRTAQYAYLINAYVDDGGIDVFARILTAGGAVETHKIRDKVSYNGGSVTAKQAYSALLKDGQIERQLITYGLSAEGEINKINTANTNNLYSGQDEPSSVFAIYSQGHGRYRNNNRSFNSKYLIEADTPIFVVPASRELNDYSVRTASSLSNGTSYYISVYDIDEYMTAGAIVLDELESDPQMLKSARSILVTEISEGFDEEEGDNVTIVEGYQQGSQVTLYAKDGDAIKDSEGNLYSIGKINGYKEIGKGDVIQASLDSDGKLLGFRVMYKADETKKKLVIAPNDSPNEYEEGGNANEFADLFVLHGTVKARSAEILVVESDTKRAHRITNGVSVYVVKNNKIEKVTTGDIYVGDEVYLHTYQGNIQEVVIYR